MLSARCDPALSAAKHIQLTDVGWERGRVCETGTFRNGLAPSGSVEDESCQKLQIQIMAEATLKVLFILF